MIAEYNSANALQRRYVHGPGIDNPIVWYEGTGTADKRFLHADERGTIVAVSNASGGLIGINTYDEYGIPRASNVGRFQYTGQTWLPEAGLFYYKARMYSPTLGRFMQTDPIGYADGMNWYAYVGNDPVNATDPSGLYGEGCRTLSGSRIRDCSARSTVSLALSEAGFSGGGLSAAIRFVFGSGSLEGVADAAGLSRDLIREENRNLSFIVVTGQLNGDQLGLREALRRFNEGENSRLIEDQKACFTNESFINAVIHPDFHETLFSAIKGHLQKNAEHSFLFGPLLGFGPNGFSAPATLGLKGASDISPTISRPLPLIGFHTHSTSSRLSPEDRDAATVNQFPVVAFNISDGTFTCAFP